MPFGLVVNRIDLLPGQPGPEPIRLQTLIHLRWVAIVGQLAAVVAALVIGAEFPVFQVLAVIGLAIALNVWLSIWKSRRITAYEAAWQLGFDLWQIATLLALTGGMTNPFALLLLVPVTIAATTLPGRQLLALGLATLIMLTLAALFAQPLTFHQDRALAIERPDLVGHWVAIVIGAVFFSLYARRVTAEITASTDAIFATRMALEREQKLQHLGGVVAAAAHEMGTPLATIKLVSSELADEIHDALPDRSDLAEDLAILRQSADRCRDILRSMGSIGKDDLLIQQAPLEQVLAEAADPHAERGITVDIHVAEGAPIIRRDAAIIHGLRNVIQNAVDFAQSRVIVSGTWDRRALSVSVADDGPGFPMQLLSRIGQPFLTTRPKSEDGRGYDGMGLGVFIAKTLLERSGARLDFGNGEKGALVTITWPLDLILADDRAALGENPRIEM